MADKFKPSTTNLYSDFFEFMFQPDENGNIHKPTEKEIKAYAETFTKYLNANADDTNRVMKDRMNKKKMKKEVNIHRFLGFKYFLGVFSICLELLAYVGIMVSSFIALKMSIINYNVIMPIIFIIGGAFMIYGTLGSVRMINSLYLQFKNTKNLHVGSIYIYDINGITYSSIKGPNPNLLMPVEDETYHNDPLFVRITMVTNKYIYLLDISNSAQYQLPLEFAYLLTLSPDSEKEDTPYVAVRYPFELPSFVYEDVKILEAAIILAKNTNNSRLYDSLNGLLAKLRFYAEHPYCGVYKEERDNINNNISKFASFLGESLFSSFKDRTENNNDSSDFLDDPDKDDDEEDDD